MGLESTATEDHCVFCYRMKNVKKKKKKELGRSYKCIKRGLDLQMLLCVVSVWGKCIFWPGCFMRCKSTVWPLY